MTLKKKLTEVGTVDPTLADHVVTNQAQAVKQSKLQKIYDLFKAGYDLIYAKTADLAGYVTSVQLTAILTNYATLSDVATSIATALSSYTTTANLNILLASKQGVYIDTGASGAFSVILNSKSGYAVFTAPIVATTTATFTITNAFCTTSSKVFWSVMYVKSGGQAGDPIAANHEVKLGSIDFFIRNIGVAQTNGVIQVNFEILN